jgi:hypothetical protein
MVPKLRAGHPLLRITYLKYVPWVRLLLIVNPSLLSEVELLS